MCFSDPRSKVTTLPRFWRSCTGDCNRTARCCSDFFPPTSSTEQQRDTWPPYLVMWHHSIMLRSGSGRSTGQPTLPQPGRDDPQFVRSCEVNRDIPGVPLSLLHLIMYNWEGVGHPLSLPLVGWLLLTEWWACSWISNYPFLESYHGQTRGSYRREGER